MADELDALYAAKPEEFTPLRGKLSAAARQRGDAEAAKQISAARKLTTAAWVVNSLVHADASAKRRLTELGERLRAAHAEMDGARIRELSGEQRRLIDDLARAAFERAGLTNPTASLRDDVITTLQAAVADPDVAQRLGRLAKAEQWSGFGEFGDTAIVFSSTRGRKAKEKDTEKEPGKEEEPAKQKARAAPAKGDASADQRADQLADQRAEERRRQEARAALAAAERAKAEADDALTELQSDLATARLKRDDARNRLQDAERALAAAEDAYEAAKQASKEATARVKEARKKANARLKRGS